MQRAGALTPDGMGGFKAPAALMKFTIGVLKLPAAYWVDACEALWACDWRHATTPIAFIRQTAVAKHKKRAKNEASGTHLDDCGKPVYIMQAIPEGQRSNVRMLMGDGIPLGTPQEIPAPACEIEQAGRLILESERGQLFTGDDDSLDDEDRATNAFGDAGSYADWVLDQYGHGDTDFKWPHQYVADDWHRPLKGYGRGLKSDDPRLEEVVYDWSAIARAAGLDPDETQLLKARARCVDDRQARKFLGWDSARLENTSKRLLRKNHVLKKVLWNQSENIKVR